MAFSFAWLLVAAIFAVPAVSLSPAGWRSQSIYQVMVDRFARTDISTSAACDTSDQIYCGGSWQGLISKLDYIQNMGFTAVWISPIVSQMFGDTSDGESYHVSKTFLLNSIDFFQFPPPKTIKFTYMSVLSAGS